MPITYSLDEGLESVLHRYKSGVTGWSSFLGSVLWDFLFKHLRCIERITGAITHATLVPPRVSRCFHPMEAAIGRIAAPQWTVRWDTSLIQRVKHDRHHRGTMDADFYAVREGASLTGAVVLVADDTWTSGASMASVAHRLRLAGARHVVGVPIGRQIGKDADTYGTNAQLRSEIPTRAFDSARCVLCT